MSLAIDEADLEHEPAELSGEAYVAFIQQLQLERIWLKSTRVTNASRGNMPHTVSVTIDDSHSWSDSGAGFQAFHKYTAEFKGDRNRKLAKVEVEFGLDYASDEPMNDELFEVFAETNLPLNSWPYFREYLSSTVSRIGWIPFTLPARKIVSAPTFDDDDTA